jgi:hypothetical protein
MARFTHPANDGTGISAVVPFYGLFNSTTTQQALVPNVTQAVMVENTVLSQGVSVQKDENNFFTKITFDNPGVYNLQFSGQIHHTGGGGTGEIFTMWFRKNGEDIPESRTIWHVPNGKFLAPALSFVFTIESPGDYVQLVGYPDNASIVLEAIVANGVSPSVPSMIISISQIG